MKLRIADLEDWRTKPVSITTKDGVVVTGVFTATIPAEPFGRCPAGRRARLVLRGGNSVAYIRTDEVAEITADGRRRRRCAA